jgi:hypothetical protein
LIAACPAQGSKAIEGPDLRAITAESQQIMVVSKALMLSIQLVLPGWLTFS